MGLLPLTCGVDELEELLLQLLSPAGLALLGLEDCRDPGRAPFARQVGQAKGNSLGAQAWGPQGGPWGGLYAQPAQRRCASPHPRRRVAGEVGSTNVAGGGRMASSRRRTRALVPVR